MEGKLLLAILLVSIAFISGCVGQKKTGAMVYVCGDGEEVNEASLCKSTTTTVLPTTTTIEIRKNCRELGGHLCSSEGECAVSWLTSSESFCCPIECNTCTQDVLDDCKSYERCIEAVCGPDTYFVCVYRNIIPCANNGICEQGEYHGYFEICDGDTSYISGVFVNGSYENSDCPDNCNDDAANTRDFYNLTTQRCEHVLCSE